MVNPITFSFSGIRHSYLTRQLLNINVEGNVSVRQLRHTHCIDNASFYLFCRALIFQSTQTLAITN